MPSGGRLHARLDALLRGQGWDGLTEAQEAAMAPLMAGRHVLLVAPTGHGKTEAALLPVLSRLLAERDAVHARRGAWPPGVKALYVTPLRALNRDLLRRLKAWGEALRLEVGVRHGDTTASERARQARRPPEVLITTPETVQLLLYGDTLRRHLRTLRAVVLDEVHDLAASERGAQLMVALERIEEVVAQPEELAAARAPERTCPDAPHARADGMFQRIGLSATVADPDAVATFVGGVGRHVERVVVRAAKRLRLDVVAPEAGEDDARRAADLALPPEAVAQLRAVRGLVASHRRVLVFQNTRDAAELMVSRSRMIDEGLDPAGADGGPPPSPPPGPTPAASEPSRAAPSPSEPKGSPHAREAPSGPEGAATLELHHGSLSKEHREDVEERFKDGRLRAIVATSSLELGIDVGEIDHVVQVHSPRSVARLVQRLGRAGHRVGVTSEGTLVAGGAEDVLECVAVATRAQEGRLEPLTIRPQPLVVLANQLVALANEYAELERGWAFAVVRRAAVFADLEEEFFDLVWRTLMEVETLFPAERPDRIARGGRARRHFLEHLSLIPDERAYRVVDESTKRTIGRVDDAFVAAGLHPGAVFIMAGRSWQVLEVETEAERLRVAPVRDLGAVPQWTGSQLPVSFEVAQEVARLRGKVARRDPALDGLPGDAAAWRRAAGPVHEHVKAGLQVPTDTLVTVEAGQRSITCNVALGTRGNEALGRVTQALLHQRLGVPVAMESDAYRIFLQVPQLFSAGDIEELWRTLDPDTLEMLLALVLRDAPVVRHHLVHVAKHFGALPPRLDPNRTTRARLDALLANMALHEETLSRLVHERLDLGAVANFLRDLAAGRVRIVVQATGPISRLGLDEQRRLLSAPRTDATLVKHVRERIEASDVLMACCTCSHTWPSRVADLPRRIRCRRCQSIQVACLRPWNEELLPLLKRPPASLSPEETLTRERLVRNGAIVASFGSTACRCLVGRGVGPDTAARILQKVMDPENPAFWREILQAELTFARTNAFWRR